MNAPFPPTQTRSITPARATSALNRPPHRPWRRLSETAKLQVASVVADMVKRMAASAPEEQRDVGDHDNSRRTADAGAPCEVGLHLRSPVLGDAGQAPPKRAPNSNIDLLIALSILVGRESGVQVIDEDLGKVGCGTCRPAGVSKVNRGDRPRQRWAGDQPRRFPFGSQQSRLASASCAVFPVRGDHRGRRTALRSGRISRPLIAGAFRHHERGGVAPDSRSAASG